MRGTELPPATAKNFGESCSLASMDKLQFHTSTTNIVDNNHNHSTPWLAHQ